ncbi:hypothetical protein Vretimale_14749, partial [Volvox reticuliferus]
MDKATIGLLSIFIVASCTVVFGFASHGFPGGRRFLQDAAILQRLAETPAAYDKDAQAWTVKASNQPSPPPPAALSGRSPILPLAASVGLMLAGCSAGLFLIALFFWIKSYVTWDFNLRDLIMVTLGRHRQMPVVPRDSLPRDEAAEAAAATVAATAMQEADQRDPVPAAGGLTGTATGHQQQQQQQQLQQLRQQEGQPMQQEQQERGFERVGVSSGTGRPRLGEGAVRGNEASA